MDQQATDVKLCSVCMRAAETLHEEHEPGCPRAEIGFCACDLRVCESCVKS